MVSANKKIATSLYLTLILTLLILDGKIRAQDVTNEGVVTYSYKNNGKVMEDASLKMYYKDGVVGYESTYRRSSAIKERQYLNYNDKSSYQVLNANSEERYFTTMDPTTIYGRSTMFQLAQGGLTNVKVLFGDPTMTCYAPDWIEPTPVEG